MKVSKEFKVGLFVVSGITILYLGFNYLKGVDFFSSNNKFYAVYSNVDGLNESNPVFISGFAVGRVSRIKLIQNDGDKVLVELELKEGIIVGDSAAATLNSDFLGNKSIALHPGDISKPLKGGDTLIALLDRGLADILAESAQPVANNLEATIKKVNGILDKVSRAGGKIDSILTDFKGASAAIKPSILRIRSSLDTTLSTYDKLGKKLNDKLDKLNPILNNVNHITDSLKSLRLNETVARVNTALEKLSQAIENFSESKGTLGKLINSDSLYNNLNQAILSLDRLLIHFDTSPKHFLSPLGKSSEKIERERRKKADKEP